MKPPGRRLQRQCDLPNRNLSFGLNSFSIPLPLPTTRYRPTTLSGGWEGERDGKGRYSGANILTLAACLVQCPVLHPLIPYHFFAIVMVRSARVEDRSRDIEAGLRHEC